MAFFRREANAPRWFKVRIDTKATGLNYEWSINTVQGKSVQGFDSYHHRNKGSTMTLWGARRMAQRRIRKVYREFEKQRQIGTVEEWEA